MKSGLTFGRGLRTILRADPDVLLVGEIRDEETARIAVQAALTGHLVLSTLHAHNAASSIARLKDMGVEPNLLSTSINAIVAQRLARRLCVDCRQPCDPPAEEKAELDADRRRPALQGRRLRAVRRDTGYRGRVALYEVMPFAGQAPRPRRGARPTRSSPPPSSRACARCARTACASRSPGSPPSTRSGASRATGWLDHPIELAWPSPPPSIHQRGMRRPFQLGLLGKFALASAVPLLLMGLVLGTYLAHRVRDRTLAQSRTSAELIARLGYQSQITGPELARGELTQGAQDGARRGPDVQEALRHAGPHQDLEPQRPRRLLGQEGADRQAVPALQRAAHRADRADGRRGHVAEQRRRRPRPGRRGKVLEIYVPLELVNGAPPERSTSSCPTRRSPRRSATRRGPCTCCSSPASAWCG